MKTAVIVLSHGSRTYGADDAVQRLIDDVKKRGDFYIVEHAFLQYESPSAGDMLESCARRKAERIVIVPFFMQLGAHVARDIPELVQKARQQHPHIDIRVSDYVGSHPLMAQIVMDLVGKIERRIRNGN